MTEHIEEFCRECGDRFDVSIGCRCVVVQLPSPATVQEPVITEARVSTATSPAYQRSLGLQQGDRSYCHDASYLQNWQLMTSTEL